MPADDRNTRDASSEERIEFTFSAKVAIRQYFATQHLWAAKHFALECAQLEDNLIAQRDSTPNLKHRSMAIGAVFTSVAFLEALVNEVLQDTADGLHDRSGFRADGIVDPAANLLGGLWSNGRAVEFSSIVDKYQMTLLGVGAEQFRSDHNPLRPVLYLISLRNALVHFKPETIDSETEHKLEKKLKPLIRENQQPVGNPWYPNKLFGAGLAEWACASASSFAEEWSARVGLTNSFLTEMASFPSP